MYFGIDIGGTTMRVAAFGNRDSAKEFARQDLPSTRSFSDDLLTLVTAINELTPEGQTVQGIGLGVAGKVDGHRATLVGAGNLDGWVEQPIWREMTARFDCPVVLGNDAEAAGMAEALYGHGPEMAEDFWFIIWGTGVGGCLVRRRDPGWDPFPGEPGHQMVATLRSKIRCGCGQENCLEAYVGGQGIDKYYGRPAEQLSPNEWERVVIDLSGGVRNLVTIQPTPHVVFGGGIANKRPELLDEVAERLKDDLVVVPPPRIRLSKLGEDTGCVGALALLGLVDT